jgi:hypothetical protein
MKTHMRRILNSLCGARMARGPRRCPARTQPSSLVILGKRTAGVALAGRQCVARTTLVIWVVYIDLPPRPLQPDTVRQAGTLGIFQ